MGSQESSLASQFESIKWTFHGLNLVYRYGDLTPKEISQSQRDKWALKYHTQQVIFAASKATEGGNMVGMECVKCVI